MLEIPKQTGTANTLTVIISSVWEPLSTLGELKEKALNLGAYSHYYLYIAFLLLSIVIFNLGHI